MTFDDDCIRLHLGIATPTIPLKKLGLEWPPPERLTELNGHPLDPDDPGAHVDPHRRIPRRHRRCHAGRRIRLRGRPRRRRGRGDGLMGLDTTHDCWHGPYSSFREFRDAVAIAAKEHFDYVPDYQTHPARAYQGWWDDNHRYTHPLDIFFVHSDCDGYIFPNDAGVLIPALEPLVHLLPNNGEDEWRPSPRKKLRQFIDGLQNAYDESQIVEFR